MTNEEIVIREIEEYTGEKGITGESRLEDLDLDSMDLAQLSIDLEYEFEQAYDEEVKFDIDPKEIGKWVTVNDIVVTINGMVEEE